jgi:uncharacterized OB-fold protein
MTGDRDREAIADEPIGTTRPDYDEWTSTLWEDGIILGQHCPNCGHETAAPKAACAHCGARPLETVRLPTEGTLYSRTTIHVTPEGFDGPYDVALVDLGDARVLGRVFGSPAIGDSVAVVDVVESEIGPAPVFGPVEDRGSGRR